VICARGTELKVKEHLEMQDRIEALEDLLEVRQGERHAG
jgi:hypothetical protein